MSYSECVNGGKLCTGCMYCYDTENEKEYEDEDIYELMPVNLSYYFPKNISSNFEFIKLLFKYSWAFKFDENWMISNFAECAENADIQEEKITVDWGGRTGLQTYERCEIEDWTTIDIDSYFNLSPKCLMYMSEKISDFLNK